MSKRKKSLAEPHLWNRVESIFHQAIETPQLERAALIRRLAGNDANLIREVESLVCSAVQSSEFLENRHDLCSTVFTQIVAEWSKPTAPVASPPETAPLEGMIRIDSCETGPSPVNDSGGPKKKEQIPRPTRADGSSLAHQVDLAMAREYLACERPDLEFRDQIGEGAAGIVIRALDRRMGRQVAIKFLHRDWASRLGEEYLEREAQAAAISSDHIVRVYEVSPRSSKIPFLVMEWISGPTLRAWLIQHDAASPAEAARLTAQISKGLAAAHQCGFIHGDIKPANVMLEPLAQAGNRDADQTSMLDESLNPSLTLESFRAKLADFGLARKLDSGSVDRLQHPSDTSASGNARGGLPASNTALLNSTAEGAQSELTQRPRHFMGTPAYASPEHLLDLQANSIASDLWSVGATLYHLLVGVPPFTGRPHAIVRQMQSWDLKPPRQWDSRIPRDLESICLKALARSPADRYNSAQEFHDDLQRFLSGQPVRARPISMARRLVRLARRKPLISTLIGLLFLVLITGTLISNFYRIRAERHLGLATENFRKAAEERDRAETVINLLQGMISAADANYGDREVKMVDALEGLESRIALDLVDVPDVEADVRRALGNMYFSLAEYEKSRFHLQRAVELRDELKDYSKAIEDRVSLANTLRWLYLPQEALQTSLDQWNKALEVFGENHSTTIRAGEVLAGCFQDLGKYSDSESHYRKVITWATRYLGATDEMTLSARSGLASLLIDSGRYAPAEVELRNIILTREAAGLAGNRESLILASNLGLVLAELGRLDEAIEQQKLNVQLSARILGELHDSTLTSSMNLAESLRRVGRSEEALELSEALLERCINGLGWNNNGTLGALESVVLMQVRLKKFDDALRRTDMAMDQLRPELENDSDWIVRLASFRAAALAGLGQFDESLATFEKAIDHYEKKYGKNYAYTLTLRNNYGVALIDAQRPDDAIEIYRTVLEDITDTFDSMRPVFLRNMGHALLSAGRLAEARVHLEEARSLSRQRGEVDNVERCEQLLVKCQLEPN